MKKYLLIATVAISTVHETKSMDYIIRLKQYIFGCQQSIENLPIIGAFQEFNVDAREFIPELDQNKSSSTDLLSIKLQTRCSKLNKGETPCNSAKDIEILSFAKDMAAYEKKWKNWHTIDQQLSDNNETNTKKNIPVKSNSPEGIKHFLATKVATGKIDKNNGDEIIKTIRQDENSPYYKWASTTDPIVVMSNLMENEAYHDELKFLKTRLRKMNLYWNIKPTYTSTWEWFITRFTNRPTKKELQQEDFDNTRNLVKDEIRLFKNKRRPFTHSCLRNTDFKNLQAARDDYKKNQENVS